MIEVETIETTKGNSDKLKYIVDDFRNKYTSLWYSTTTEFPSLDKEYSYREKRFNEKALDKFINNLLVYIENIPENSKDFHIWQRKVMDSVRDFFKNTLGFKEEYLNIIFSEGYLKVTNEFIKKAKKFNSNISIYDIFQAIRNVWIMNSIQIFLGEDIKLTPSVFAYSMLYPYTDNYLDDTNFSKDEKIQFNNRFRRRLEGKDVIPKSHHEGEVFKLVSIIEEDFDRDEYPLVYEGLLSIHKGQESSLLQQKQVTFPYEKDILGISFEKGGTSVLADGYLINGNMTNIEGDFMFGYGVFLQLADDLQDINTDILNNHMTIFSQLAKKWPLDRITNRLFWFMKSVLTSGGCFITTRSEDVLGLIENSCKYLIFGAICGNKNLYSKKYIREIEKYYQFRFSYQRKFERKLKKKFKKINIDKIKEKLDKLDLI